MNSKKAELLMVSVSFVWGSSYLLMKIGLGSIAPFNLIALRFGIAFLFMTLIFFPKYRLAKRSDMVKGILMGILLFLTFSGMVYGVNRTTASTAGFLASTTVIFIPILESLIRKKLPHRLVLFSIALAGTGLYLLTAKSGLSLTGGSFYCLAGAFFYAVYILLLERTVKTSDTLLLSMIQFGVIAACAVICMMLFEKPALPSSPVQWAAVLCLGLFCSAYGFIAQSVAQKYTTAEKIGLIFSLEPVFSAVLSFLILHEILDWTDYLGAGFILTGVILSKLLPAPKIANAEICRESLG